MARLAPTLQRLLQQPEEVRRLGPFLLLRQLGRGGFAPVWLAREQYGATELRLVALKLFSMGAAGNTTQAASHKGRILEEARALCRVEHPNVVRFYSLAFDEEAGVVGVAMEHLAGASLEDRLARTGALPLADALDVGVAVASALGAVHRAGLVHRDVKPANVLDSAGVYKLIDFGIATAEDERPKTRPGLKAVLVDELPIEVESAVRHRIAGAVTIRARGEGSTTPPSSFAPRGGTVGYVDPACISDGALPTPASDLFALGVLLFECIAGRHPASVSVAAGDGLSEDVLSGRANAPALAQAAPGVPRALAALVDSLLSPDRARRPRSAEWVAIELDRIRAEAAGARRERPPESVGPFRGLGRFEETDRDVYFGRASEIAAGLELLRSHALVTLIGPSGSGKSSLARAGIVPRVVDGALGAWPPRWDVAVTSPGTDPRAALLAALRAAVPDLPVDDDVRPEVLVQALGERVHRAERGVLLVVDQLEELVTASGAESRSFAASLLCAAAEARLPGVRVLVAVRRDLLDPVLALDRLGGVFVRGSLLVEPIGDTAWMDVVVQSLSAYGYELESAELGAELARQLAGTAGAMPLVQFALTELWAKRDAQGKRIRRASLDAIGGISGALERHAEATLESLAGRDGDAAAGVRDVLLALTTPRGTRATKPREDVVGADPRADRALAALEGARLVVAGEEGVTLAHEALLTQWSRLRAWVAEVREDRIFAEELDREADKWRTSPEMVPLLKKRRLAAADDLTRRGSVALSPAVVDLVAQSKRAERRQRLGVRAGALALSIVLTGLAGAYVRAARAGERTALEKAAVEEQKAAVERQRRQNLEEAQAEIDRRQAQIDQLLEKLAVARDEATAGEVRRELAAARTGAEQARARIALPSRPAEPAAAPAPAPTATPVAAPTHSIKVQRED